MEASARARATERLPEHQKILRIEMRSVKGAKKRGLQNSAHVVTRCDDCEEECTTLVKTLLETKNGPACSCTGEAVWKGEKGYLRMTRLMQSCADTRHHEPAFDLPWWLSHASSQNSQIPMRCTLCGVTVSAIHISNAQQGRSVGCGCQPATCRKQSCRKQS